MRMRRFDIVEGGIVLDDDHRRAEGILRDLSSQGVPPPPYPDPKLTGE
jgi:circadian clock protein KaiC